MPMRTPASEAQRRKIDPSFDLLPTYGHKFIAKFIRPYIKSKKVLDIGCWTGQLEGLIQKDVTTLIGIEPNREAVKFAKLCHPGTTFLVASADHLPFHNRSFDVVLLLDVLEHVPPNTEEIVLKEICRILKKGGILILTTPHTHWLSIAFDPAYFLIGHRHYKEQEIINLLGRVGLSIQSFKRYGGIAHLTKCLIDIASKHAFHKKIDIYPLLRDQIKREFFLGGFASLFVVAKRANTIP
ncbi:MAG: class I SAM-dependent methyltransferase [Parcubacteria group bacterium]|nr:class I SAM-dependent methyltransferase [Parcubacteria group bacterium]